MGTVIKIITTGATGYICGKTLKVFGKKDCADIVNGVTTLAVGVLVIGGIVSGWEWLSNTAVIQSADKLLDGVAWIIYKVGSIGELLN